MSLPAISSKAVFRACVVNAVRGGEEVMKRLVDVSEEALTVAEAEERNPRQRNALSDALVAIRMHGPAMVKGFPMALLENFAEGPGSASAAKSEPVPETGLDFGELSLVDDDEMLDHIELSKAQQLAVHATEAVLGELNALVSAAQGLRSVQAERNPLRPENYIRALQRVVSDTGAPPEQRQLWMQHMRGLLGSLLVDEYKKASVSLREHGIQPVGYAVAAGAGSSRHAPLPAGYSGGGGPVSGYGASTGYGHSTGYGRAGTGWGQDSAQSGLNALAPEAEEALLTVGILRQMLAGGDPMAPRALMPGAGSAHGSVVAHGATGHGAVSLPGGYVSQAAVEAMEDIAQLERLVGRLSGGGGGATGAGPITDWRSPTPAMPPRVYANVPLGMGAQSPAMAAEVVARMMENIAQDTRLLPPVQRAVQNLGPALQRLVRHDLGFFDNAEHPARRMLDEMTQRSMAFAKEADLGFSAFMRLLDEAVAHLSRIDIKDAAPFENVLKALLSAWDTQERKLQHLKARAEAKEKAKRLAERRVMLAQKLSEDIRHLPELGDVPPDVMDFAAGPWAQVIALAQVSVPEGEAEDDPGGYLALVPELLWSAQPELTSEEPERLTALIPGLLSRLREGLQSIQHPPEETSAFIERLVGLHQAAFEKPANHSMQAALDESVDIDPQALDVRDTMEVVESGGNESQAGSVDGWQTELLGPDDTVQQEIPQDPMAAFRVGAWVELTNQHRTVRTQLTWASPQGTLFLFTASDGSTQSMTRRVRDKLAAEGSLRLVG